MKQSNLNGAGGTPRHVAVIMDGNGRWAAQRSRPRPYGHRAGAAAVRRVTQAAPAHGIRTLTLYAFSADNWQRPSSEVAALMRLFVRYLRTETERCVANGVCVSVIGRRDRLPDTVRAAIDECERATSSGRVMHLRLAIDYSARQAIRDAAARLLSRDATADELGRTIRGSAPDGSDVPDVDLLIRTGGEQRLSDFMLWECAYAELVFTPVQWPDFDEADLADAMAQFHNRDRRFGRIAAVR